MNYRTFGRTGLQVSEVGLGGGGESRLGLATGSTEQEALALVRRALDLGVNYFDTADNYGTEEVIGRALAGHRDEVILSTKVYPRLEDGSLLSRKSLQSALDASLRRLAVDAVDVYHLHGVTRKDYAYCVDELIPGLEAMRDAGKILNLGLSERNGSDPTHVMLQLALHDDFWDVVMVGFNLFNQSSRTNVFPVTIEKNVGVEVMASARNQFSRPERFAEDLTQLVSAGVVEVAGFDPDTPLEILSELEPEVSLTEASYRFAAHEPGVHVVLIGTGSIKHLEENVQAFDAGSLSSQARQRLISTFGHLANVVVVPDRVLRPE